MRNPRRLPTNDASCDTLHGSSQYASIIVLGLIDVYSDSTYTWLKIDVDCEIAELPGSVDSNGAWSPARTTCASRRKLSCACRRFDIELTILAFSVSSSEPGPGASLITTGIGVSSAACPSTAAGPVALARPLSNAPNFPLQSFVILILFLKNCLVIYLNRCQRGTDLRRLHYCTIFLRRTSHRSCPRGRRRRRRACCNSVRTLIPSSQVLSAIAIEEQTFPPVRGFESSSCYTTVSTLPPSIIANRAKSVSSLW